MTGYEDHLDDFEQSISTLTIQNPDDIRQAISEIMNLQTASYEVEANDSTVNLQMDTNSRIVDFRFDEESKQISLQVESEAGAGAGGKTTSISIDKLLEGPYVVTIDGEPSSDYSVIEDTITGETILAVTYSGSVQEIIVAGTQVVPEFPAAILMAIIGLGAAVVIGRSRLRY